MIVREREDEFILIEQDNHAIVSGEMMRNWQESRFYGAEFKESVHYAIRYHDYGWMPFDKQPFWNECTQAPYTFSDYPLSPKMGIYTLGIDEVEKHDPYAALLCSRHYSRFLLHDTSEVAFTFLEQEKERQKRIIKSIGALDYDLFNFHYGLLRLGDDLSLYICLNEPGVSKEKEHHFFQNGITLPTAASNEQPSIMKLKWIDQSTIVTTPFPFNESMPVSIKQKVINKQNILKHGLIKSYEDSPYDDDHITLSPDK